MDVDHSFPEELTDFIPESILTISVSTWKIVDNESEGTIEIVRNTFLNTPTIIITTALVLCCCCIAVLGYVFSNALPDQVRFFCIWTAGLGGGLFFLVVIPLLSALGIWANSLSWPNKVRFHFNKNTGEILLSRDHARYFRKECQELVLGYTTSYDTRNWRKAPFGFFGRPMSERYSGPKTSLFLLVKKDDHWIRHLIAYDSVSTNAKQAVQVIPPILDCKVSTRYIGSHESFAAQHVGAIPTDSSKKEALPQFRSFPKRDWKRIIILPVILSIVGLCLLGYGSTMFISGYATSSWPTTPATVIQCKMDRVNGPGDSKTEYRPTVEYVYVVAGNQYIGKRIKISGQDKMSYEKSQEILDSYPKGATVQVHYSITNPAQSVLIPGVTFDAWFYCVLGSMFALVSVAVLLVSSMSVARI